MSEQDYQKKTRKFKLDSEIYYTCIFEDLFKKPINQHKNICMIF